MTSGRCTAACVVAAALAVAACSDTGSPGAVLDQRPVDRGATTAVAAASTTGAPAAAASTAVATTVAPTTVTPTTVTPTTVTPTTVVPTTVAPTAGSAPPTTAAPAPPASIEQVRFGDMAHDLGEGGGIVGLVNGTYLRGQPGTEEFLLARLVHVTTGDIDGDDVAEAAVTLAWTTGGTGQFTDVLVYRWVDGAPAPAARAGVGDRAFDGVRRTAVVEGALVVDRYDGDAACCPLDVVRQAWRLDGDRLVASGRSRRWRIVYLDADPVTPGDEPVRFRPGTTGAFLAGGVVSARRGGFTAAAGQTLTLDVAPPRPGGAVVVVDVVRGDEVLGTARPGAPLQLTLPASGPYAVVARVESGPPGDAELDAELSIT